MARSPPLVFWATLTFTALGSMPTVPAAVSFSQPTLRPGGPLLGGIRGGDPTGSPDSSGGLPAAYEDEIRAPLRVAQRLYEEAVTRGDVGGDWGIREHLKRKLRGNWDKVRMQSQD